MFAKTNSQFLAASLSEFMMFWSTGGESSLNLTTSKGLATVNFNCFLGHPGELNSSSSATTPTPPSRQPRHRGPAEIRRNNERAARHQAARVTTAALANTASTSPKATAPVTQTSHQWSFVHNLNNKF